MLLGNARKTKAQAVEKFHSAFKASCALWLNIPRQSLHNFKSPNVEVSLPCSFITSLGGLLLKVLIFLISS